MKAQEVLVKEGVFVELGIRFSMRISFISLLLATSTLCGAQVSATKDASMNPTETLDNFFLSLKMFERGSADSIWKDILREDELYVALLIGLQGDTKEARNWTWFPNNKNFFLQEIVTKELMALYLIHLIYYKDYGYFNIGPELRMNDDEVSKGDYSLAWSSISEWNELRFTNGLDCLRRQNIQPFMRTSLSFYTLEKGDSDLFNDELKE